MNLSELHQRLSQKPAYRKAYDAIGDVVLMARQFGNCAKMRK